MKGSVLLAAVVVSAIALATGLPYSDYCIGCMTTVESLFLLHRESKIVGNELPTASDITMLLCDAAYFDVFQDFVKDGCKQMRNSAPNTFRSMVADALTSEFELANPSDSKKEYFSFAREICERKFKACSANTFRFFEAKQERTPCAACKITIKEMSVFFRTLLSTNITQVMETVCPSLGYKNQPGSWLEDECFELLDEHNEALKAIFHEPLTPKDEDAICDSFHIGCPKRVNELTTAGGKARRRKAMLIHQILSK